ncbi:MAG: bifunctional phosphoglucose/phosphomannose isomerase [Bacteroidota bacterium]
MQTLISNFSDQLSEAIRIGEEAIHKFQIRNLKYEIKNVLISGLGGSGIGGTIVSELMAIEANVPITVNKGYFIPNFVNENTLVIISSYSGNTEETINVMELALKRNAIVICVTSGGKISDIAKSKSLDIITIPEKMPPRACLGYSLTQLFFILGFYHIIGKNFKSKIEASVKLLEEEKTNIITEAKSIAEKISKKIPVIYATTYFEGVAVRFRQQINENAKMLCWHHVIPEMNHNELVGWKQKNEDLAVIIFRDTNEFERNNTRIEINKKIISQYTSTLIEIWSKGNSQIEKTIYFIHLGDWISYFLAEQSGVDAVEVKVIDYLKDELSKIKE